MRRKNRARAMDIDFTPLERIRAAYEPLIKHLDFDEEEEKEKVPTNQERSGSRMQAHSVSNASALHEHSQALSSVI
jgi:hypothetical protein